MKVRRFTASSMQKALKTVRDEMGPDAVILSNHRVNGGVEIIVAQNYEPISAKKSAPVFESDEFEDQIAPKAQLKQATNKNENPWPFLNASERTQVEEQLKLQDQLETLKRQREGENHTVSKPQINVSSQSDLQNSLQQIKQQRQDPNYGYEPVKQQANTTYTQSAAVDLKEQQNQKILHEVRNELNDLKDLLVSGAGSHVASQTQNFIWKKFSPANSLQAKLWQRLEQMGFEEWLIYQLTHQIKPHADEQQAWQTCLHDLALHIQISPSDRLKRGGVFALVGPTGAGKTTTIAKMAVRYTLDNDGAKVGLITMDNYRLAAHDQLRTLGQILGVPVQVADQDHPLSQCIKQLEECDLILIDTAGLTPEHPMLKYQLDQIAHLKSKVNTLLTLPATSSSRVLRKVYHNYKSANLNGCILTKVDEASSLGDALSMLLECKLNLAYSTDGQRIPDDFDPANAKYLVKQAVKIAQHEQQYTPNQDVAAGAW